MERGATERLDWLRGLVRDSLDCGRSLTREVWPLAAAAPIVPEKKPRPSRNLGRMLDQIEELAKEHGPG